MQHEEIAVDLTPAAKPRQEVTRVLAVTESHVEEGASELVSEGADQSEHQEVSCVVRMRILCNFVIIEF